MGIIVGDLFYLLRKDLISSKSQCSKEKEKYFKICTVDIRMSSKGGEILFSGPQHLNDVLS